MGKLSKSKGQQVVTKMQVFKVGNRWLAACQEGCPNKYVPGASQALMFKIAEDHMRRKHKDCLYRRSAITLAL